MNDLTEVIAKNTARFKKRMIMYVILMINSVVILIISNSAEITPTVERLLSAVAFLLAIGSAIGWMRDVSRQKFVDVNELQDKETFLICDSSKQ